MSVELRKIDEAQTHTNTTSKQPSANKKWIVIAIIAGAIVTALGVAVFATGAVWKPHSLPCSPDRMITLTLLLTGPLMIVFSPLATFGIVYRIGEKGAHENTRS